MPVPLSRCFLKCQDSLHHWRMCSCSRSRALFSCQESLPRGHTCIYYIYVYFKKSVPGLGGLGCKPIQNRLRSRPDIGRGSRSERVPKRVHFSQNELISEPANQEWYPTFRVSKTCRFKTTRSQFKTSYSRPVDAFKTYQQTSLFKNLLPKRRTRVFNSTKTLKSSSRLDETLNFIQK